MLRAALLALISIALAGIPGGCGESDSQSANTPSSAQMPAGVVVDTYEVRAIIAELPDASNPTSGFSARHEAIPDFRSNNGSLGMKAMTMGFPVAPELDLSELSVGQKITLTFTVDYNTETQKLLGFQVTKITPLPEGTTLNFGSTPE